MARRTTLLAVVAATLAVALIVWAAWPRTAEASYVTAPAARGAITQTVSLVGPVERTGQATISYRSDGPVTAVHVRLGEQVVAGQSLVSIDPAPLRLAVLQARAQLAQAEAQLDADLTAQRSGSPSTGLPDLGSPGDPPPAPQPGPGLPGVPPGTRPPAEQPGVPAEPPAYLTTMNESLARLQTAVVTQQQQCAPVFDALQRLRELQANPPELPLPTGLPPVPTSMPPVPTGVPPLPTGLPPLPTGLPPLPTGFPPLPSPEASPTPAPTPDATPDPTSSPEPSATPDPEPSATPDPEPRPTSAPAPSTTPGPTPTPGLPQLPNLDEDLREALSRVVDLADEVEGCSNAMVALATAEAEAGAAIGAAVQGFAAQTQQAQQALQQAQRELEEAMKAAQTQVEQAARLAAEQAIREAQAQLEAQLAASFGGRVTDATIAQDRARLVQARQQVESAEADLTAATLVSPTSGVVGALDFVVGESSSGRQAVIIGEGAAEVSVEVPLTSRALVAPGVSAVVGPLASPPTLTGHVTGVSVLPTGTGAPTYRTRIVTDDPDGTLRSGSWVEATLTLAQSPDVLTVPASAVTKISDTTGTVEVVDGPMAQTAQTVTVVTGRVGQGKVEIVSGLVEGQIVVLADRRLPIPGGIDQYAGAMRPGASPTPNR